MKQKTEFIPLDAKQVDVKTFDCGKEAINTYLKRFAARNMRMGLSASFVLPFRRDQDEPDAKRHIAAYYTLANQSVTPESTPINKSLPRYPAPVILLARLGVDISFQGQGLGAITLVSALKHAYAIAKHPNGIPSIGVILDAMDDNALQFCRGFEFFIPFPGDPMRLYVPIDAIALLTI